MMDLSRRVYLEEEMDRPDSSEARLIRTLQQFETLNVWFSGYRRLLARNVLADLRQAPAHPRVLADLGAGGCDVARWLVRCSRRLGTSLRITAVEQDERAIRYAQAANAGYPEITMCRADLLDPQVWAGADYVFANHTFHHLDDAACIRLLQLLDRAGVRRYVISDLIRSPWSYQAFRLLVAPLFRRSFVAVDGLTSIRRGFTRPEVEALLQRAAPVHPARVRPLWPARFVIEGGTLPLVSAHAAVALRSRRASTQ